MTALTAIVLLPILIAAISPCVARGECGRGGNGKRAFCLRDDDSPGETGYNKMIDPPMFLCGIGCLPLDCGLSGLLTVIAAFGFAFATMFYAMLNSTRPCTTPLGACRTISCACGNLLTQGYIFMFALLVLTATILVQRFSRMTQHHRIQHRTIKPIMVVGSLLLTLTGIFPEKYDANGEMTGIYAGMYNLHLLGVFGSGVCLLWVPYFWFLEHWWTHRRRSGEEVPLRSILTRSVYFVATLVFALCFAVGTSDRTIHDSTVQYCTMLDTKESCDAWPSLTPADCEVAQSCLNGTDDSAVCDGAKQPNFSCSWEPTQKFSAWTRLIASGTDYVESAACIRSTCPLYKYARGVALEFALLLLTLTYVSSFALHDVRRLLDRQPRAGGGSAAEVHNVDTGPRASGSVALLASGAVPPLTAPQ